MRQIVRKRRKRVYEVNEECMQKRQPGASEGEREKRQPGVGMSLAVFGAAIAVLLTGVVLLDYDIHIVLICALAVVCLASVSLGYSFMDLVGCMKKSLGQALAAMIIFLFIGVMIASLIFSGTVPALIYYGLQYIIPDYFLPIGLMLCSLTSISIGTSWGTVGTMGLAMMGIGAGMGIPAPLTAGMVISGAFFGDKMSSISDSTNLAPAAAGTTLYAHIEAMWKTTLPSYLITLAAFTVLGLSYKGGNYNVDTVNLFLTAISGRFHITPLVLLPIVVLLGLNLKKYPAVPSMGIGAILAVVIAVVYQGTPLKAVAAGLNFGYVKPTGVELVDKLLLRGGIQSMMYTFSLSCIAIAFGGVMEHVGYLPQIVKVIIRKVKNDKMMVPVVIASTTVGTLTMGEVFLSIVVNGSLYKDAFKKRGLRPELLSRLLEEGGTLTQVFIPWSTSGVFILSTLGVGVSQYWKYAILNYVNPLLSIVLAMFGIYILRIGDEKRQGVCHRLLKSHKLS